jgi:hypothetical protein
MRFISTSKRQRPGFVMPAKGEPPRAQSARIGWHDWKEPERGIPSVPNLSRIGKRLLTKSDKSSPSPEAQPRSIFVLPFDPVHPAVIPHIACTGSIRDDERVSFSPHGAKGRPGSAISVSGVHEPAPQSAPLDSAGMVPFRSRMFWRSTRRIMAG